MTSLVDPGRGRISRLFPGIRPIIGMVHLGPLPGSPGFDGGLEHIIRVAVSDAETLWEAGVDGLLIENFGDSPFFKDEVPPVTIASMTRAIDEIRAHVGRKRATPPSAPRPDSSPDPGTGTRDMRPPIGVNVLRNDARAALSIAAATGASFVRVNVHIGAAATDQGVIEGRAAETMRLRATLAPEVAVLADLRVKHSRPLVERPLEEELADLIERGRADAVLVTGTRTGTPPTGEEVRHVHGLARNRVPVWVASGVSLENASDLRGAADGFIVGSAFKTEGRADGPVDHRRARALVAALRGDDD